MSSKRTVRTGKRRVAGAELFSPVARSRIQRHLLRWGRANFRPYPWRSETDPWLTFLAEFLLQRTRASQVAEMFPAISSAFPSPAALADNPSLAATITANLGLHFRAAQLVEVARQVVGRGGALPETENELRAFMGVGPYTASAWLSLHRQRRAAIVDANVARWLGRISGMPRVSDPRRVRWVRDLAEALTPKKAFRSYNYAVLDFTMTICTSRSPSCATCPLRASCAAYKQSAIVKQARRVDDDAIAHDSP
jgi:A/G-specific adenine glycosylase